MKNPKEVDSKKSSCQFSQMTMACFHQFHIIVKKYRRSPHNTQTFGLGKKNVLKYTRQKFLAQTPATQKQDVHSRNPDKKLIHQT